jgi:hydroxyacylglutathione hydrolase
MSMISIHPIPAFRDNYIWLIRFGDRQAAVVDPGDATPVLQALQQQDLELAAILITHHHWDHVDGFKDILDIYKVPVYGPDSEHIDLISHPCREGDTIAINGLELKVLEVPGHTSDHIAFHGHDALFCGDTLFAAGCGRLLGGTAAQLYESLKKISQLPISTHIYCAHEYTLANLKFAQAVEPGNGAIKQRRKAAEQTRGKNQPTLPSTLKEELATNPFLRCNEEAVIVSAENFANKKLDTPAEVFTALRLWKDNFT